MALIITNLSFLFIFFFLVGYQSMMVAVSVSSLFSYFILSQIGENIYSSVIIDNLNQSYV